MAAVLCSSIGAGCAAVGQCLAFPCTVCGSCSATLCSGVGRMLSSPFAPYLITTVVLNVPPTVWGLRTLVEVIQWGNTATNCPDRTWLYVNAALCVGHLCAAWYIVHRIQQQQQDNEDDTIPVVPGKELSAETVVTKEYPTDPEGVRVTETVGVAETPYHHLRGDGAPADQTATTPNWQRLVAWWFPGPFQATKAVHSVVVDEGPGSANSWQRLKQVLCYDIGVAVYLVAMVVWLIWQSVGISHVLFHPDATDDLEMCHVMEKRTIWSILCGFLYMMLVFVTFACSLVCLR